MKLPKLILPLLMFSSIMVKAQNFAQSVKLNPNDRAQSAEFGNAVSLEGNRSLIGSKGALNSRGAAYIFEKNAAGEWVQVQKLQPSDPVDYMEFGHAVALTGDYAFVSAQRHTLDAAGANKMTDAGAVYVFKRNGNVWAQTQKLVANDRGIQHFFGSSISAFGKVMVVGATGAYNLNANQENLRSGAAYAFVRDGSGNWNFKQRLSATDHSAGAEFGKSVFTDGAKIVVGAPRENRNSAGAERKDGAGAAYVFEEGSSYSWSQVNKLVPNDRAVMQLFGSSVLVSGNTIAVGATGNQTAVAGVNVQKDAGAVYIFSRNATGAWSSGKKIVANDMGEKNYFGTSISLSGTSLAIGAYGHIKDNGGANEMFRAGAVYVFNEQSPNIWVQSQKLVATDRALNADFGISVGISGNTILAGAKSDANNSTPNAYLGNAGSAYIFSR